MPVDSTQLNPPVQYSIIWLLIGCGLILIVVLWYVGVWLTTRKRKLKTVSDARPLTPAQNLAALKRKYLKLIDEIYADHTSGKISLRAMHRGLSMTCRYFVYEVRNFPAPRLTLMDIRRANHAGLTAVVADLYEKEFAQIEQGSAGRSVQIAKEFIQTWV